MDHMKPSWFVRLLSWIDLSIEIVLGLTIFILAAFVVAAVVEMRGLESFITGVLLGRY
jgi:hypothetical protein